MKKIKKGNIFSTHYEFQGMPEVFENLHESKHIRIERIITNGAITTPGEWYNQQQDEWVILIQGTARLEFDNGKTEELKKGEYLLIPAHCKHRVINTSEQPNCVWLAIHEKDN